MRGRRVAKYDLLLVFVARERIISTCTPHGIPRYTMSSRRPANHRLPRFHGEKIRKAFMRVGHIGLRLRTPTDEKRLGKPISYRRARRASGTSGPCSEQAD